MIDDENAHWWLLTAVICLCLAIGFLVGKNVGMFIMQQEAVSHGVGEYDDQTMKFRFLNENQRTVPRRN